MLRGQEAPGSPAGRDGDAPLAAKGPFVPGRWESSTGARAAAGRASRSQGRPCGRGQVPPGAVRAREKGPDRLSAAERRRGSALVRMSASRREPLPAD